MDDEDEYDIKERIFHNTVREYVIFLLLFLILYILSFNIIGYFRRKDREDYFTIDEDEATVYKVSLYLSTFALSVSICAVLLLPFSIVSNEVLLRFPKSYYVKWLNHSLIQGLWNLVFLFSNTSLFAFLPFAYLFTESEGFIGYRRGVRSRVYETITVLCLLAVVVFGLTYVIYAFIDTGQTGFLSPHNFWSYYLPFLYSCMSFLGVLMLLLCTPLGFIRLFGIVSRLLVKPQFLRNTNEEYESTVMYEELLVRRLKVAEKTGKSCIQPEPMCSVQNMSSEDSALFGLQNGALQTGLKERLEQLKQKKAFLQKQKATSSFQRNIVYPVAMLALLALTVITIILVLFNSLQLLVGIKALPKSTAQFTLGLTSLSKLGTLGAGIEVMVIAYMAVTSCVGFYSVPILCKMRPQSHKTPLSLLIANCALFVVLSSALPLLSRILGITNFDLLGDFGKIEWLGNFKIVFLYNILFASVTTLCFVKQLTAPVCKELLGRIKSVLSLFHNKNSHFKRPILIQSSQTHSMKED